MPRRFGPIQGAGVAVIEKDANGAITPSPFGVTCYVGVTEKGAVGEILDCGKQRDFLRKCGSYVSGSELPDAAFDFYNFSGGAGRLYVVRVTDGNETEALDEFASREPGVGEYVNRTTGTNQKRALVAVTAKNGGRWGGAERVLSFDYTIALLLTETTLATGVTMLEDEWAGATLKLLGVTSRTYKVLSNTTLGVLTVESDSFMASDLAAGEAANNAAVLYLDAQERTVNGPGLRAGARQALSLIWKDGEESQTSLFGLDILVDGVIVRSYNNLSLDPANKWFLENVINEDRDNDYITVESLHTGSYTAANRPCNWLGEYKSYAAGVLSANVAHIVSVVPNTPGNDIGFVTDFVFRDSVVRQRITLTFTAPTVFGVTSDSARGAEHLNLPAGAVGTPYETTLNADDYDLLDFIPGFTVKGGVDAFEAGDVIVFDVDPFPVDLASGDGLLSGFVFVDDGSTREKVKIASNTVDGITFSNLPAAAPTAASGIAADLVSSIDVTFPTAGGNVVLMSDVSGYVTLTYGVVASAALLVTALEGTLAAAGLPTGLFTATGDKLNVLLSTIYDAASANKGEDQFFNLISSPAELSLAAVETKGVAGDLFRLEAPRELRGGYDGAAPGDAEYISAYNTVTSVINRLRGRNLGLVKLGTPGVTSTNVQKAGVAYAEFRNYQYRIEIPSNVTSEASAVAYINDTIGRSDYAVTAWPSYMYVINPLGEGIVLQNVTGAIHGKEARTAADYLGYHKAAAGNDVALTHCVKSPLGEVEIDEEVTNPQGVNLILKKKGRFVIWGDRTVAVQPAWKFKHAREYMSNVEQTFLESFDFIIFALHDKETRKTLVPIFRQYFGIEFAKRALRGNSLDEAVQIKIDGENNTVADVESGDLNADIQFGIVGVVERFNISIGKAGITEASA